MTFRSRWKSLSIRRKAVTWIAALMLVLAALMGITAAIRSLTMTQLSILQANDNQCYAVQEALEDERQALEAVFREHSQANLGAYHQACRSTRNAIRALPFEYDEIGEERYARTWNLCSGYEGYSAFRDELMAMDPEAPEYSALYYRVAQMQEDLATYALRLALATVEEGSAVYRRTLQIYNALPALNIILIFAAVLAVTGLFRLMDRSIIAPIVQMSAQSRRIAENDFAVPDLSVRSDDEVGELILAFNRMKHATRDHIATLEENNRMESALHRQAVERLELERNLEHTRLEMLKSQVNPHFLFNTLNMISCMARLEDAESTDRMILSLSGLFRYNLRTKEQEVTLEQELEALDDYIHIQQTRFDGRIAYKKQILVDPRQVRIPSFTLQPIVENAFIHGLSSREEGGRIFLRIWQRENMLHVSVADNGRGMDEQALAELHRRSRESEQTGRGIGLGNITRRISMLYPCGGLYIHSRPGRGTVIQMEIPQKNKGE